MSPPTRLLWRAVAGEDRSFQPSPAAAVGLAALFRPRPSLLSAQPILWWLEVEALAGRTEISRLSKALLRLAAVVAAGLVNRGAPAARAEAVGLDRLRVPVGTVRSGRATTEVPETAAAAALAVGLGLLAAFRGGRRVALAGPAFRRPSLALL